MCKVCECELGITAAGTRYTARPALFKDYGGMMQMDQSTAAQTFEESLNALGRRTALAMGWGKDIHGWVEISDGKVKKHNSPDDFAECLDLAIAHSLSIVQGEYAVTIMLANCLIEEVPHDGALASRREATIRAILRALITLRGE